jgi:hypothetical protein
MRVRSENSSVSPKRNVAITRQPGAYGVRCNIRMVHRRTVDTRLV